MNLRWTILILFLSLLPEGCKREKVRTDALSRPNIILFLVDDLGWEDTSVPLWIDTVPNNRWYQTPHISQLADEGMRFTRAYASSPVCSPTRTAILSGLNPAHSGITNWIPGEGDGPAEQQKFLVPDWRVRGLDRDILTLPQLLKEAGYTTIHIGKAHFGRKGTPGADPRNLGFDVSIAGNHRGQPGSYYVPYGSPESDSQMVDLSGYYRDSLYLSDALTAEALRMIDTAMARGKPFYLSLSHYAVHTPIQGDPENMDKYRIEGKNEFQVAYATMVESVDRSLGALMKKLAERGIRDNTVLVFFSDNGGLVSHSGPPTTNDPLSSGKGSSREGGYREPLIIRWPGRIAAGSVCDVPVIAEDLFPTFARLAGTDPPDTVQQILDGTDITPLLLGDSVIDRPHPLIWHYPHYWANARIRQADSTITPFSAIREGDWKLIYLYEQEKCLLFHLSEDIGEQKDRSAEFPDITARLCNQLAQLLREMNARTPVDRASGKPVPYPHFESE